LREKRASQPMSMPLGTQSPPRQRKHFLMRDTSRPTLDKTERRAPGHCLKPHGRMTSGQVRTLKRICVGMLSLSHARTRELCSRPYGLRVQTETSRSRLRRIYDQRSPHARTNCTQLTASYAVGGIKIMPELPPTYSTATCPNCHTSGVVLYFWDSNTYTCQNCVHRWEGRHDRDK